MRKSRLERQAKMITASRMDWTDENLVRNLWRMDWKQAGFDYCCVYVIGPTKKWPMKVGVSVSPAKRIAALQTSIWEPLTVYSTFFTRNVLDARKVERTVHDELEMRGKALLGEWFDVRPNEASDAIEFAALAASVELSREPFCGLEHEAIAMFAETMGRKAYRTLLRADPDVSMRQYQLHDRDDDCA